MVCILSFASGRVAVGADLALLPPHKVLQLTELCPQVRVGRGYCLGDGGVDISYFWLRSGTKVSIPLESADIIPPELSLLGKRNVASVKILRHSDRSLFYQNNIRNSPC